MSRFWDSFWGLGVSISVAAIESSCVCRLFAVKDSSHVGDAHAFEYNNAKNLRTKKRKAEKGAPLGCRTPPKTE
eukprot:2780456-Pyramimonas_sp.AAC.1